MNLKQLDDGQIIFYGFPNGNYIRQFNLMLHLWVKRGAFPVEFVPYDVFEHTTD